MNTTMSNLPALSNEGGLSAYLDQIKKISNVGGRRRIHVSKKLGKQQVISRQLKN